MPPEGRLWPSDDDDDDDDLLPRLRSKVPCLLVVIVFIVVVFVFVGVEQIFYPGCAQRFLACSAPKPASFRHFWHMVIQEEVEFLVITKIAIIQGVFFYWSALRMTKYEEKFKYLNWSANCSSQKVSTLGIYSLKKLQYLNCSYCRVGPVLVL